MLTREIREAALLLPVLVQTPLTIITIKALLDSLWSQLTLLIASHWTHVRETEESQIYNKP